MRHEDVLRKMEEINKLPTYEQRAKARMELCDQIVEARKWEKRT